jgi:hypothetical protein
LTGKVEFKLCEAVLRWEIARKEIQQHYYSETGPNKVSARGRALLGTKSVRSGKGDKGKTLEYVTFSSYEPGKLVDAISLNCCTVPGLIRAGIFPRSPDIYEYHRVVTGKKRPAVDPMAVNGQNHQIEWQRDCHR